MSDYLKGKRVVDPVLTSIARGYKNAAFIGLNASSPLSLPIRKV